MKWRKLVELVTSSSPPEVGQRAKLLARRRAIFESLENRKLFAVDVAELAETDVVDTIAEVATFDVGTTEEGTSDQPDISLMTFRAFEATDAGFETEVAYADVSDTAMFETTMLDMESSDSEVGSPIMYMTGIVDATAGDVSGDDVKNVEVRTLNEQPEDVAVDDLLAEDHVIYTMSPNTDSEAETPSFEEALAPEDVNGDGNVTALDMLLVINALNSYGFMPSSQLTAQADLSSSASSWDINRDGYVTPLDALLVTNFFNNGMSISSSLAINNSSRIMMPTDDAEAIVADDFVADDFVADDFVADENSDAALVAPPVARIRNPADDGEVVDDAPITDTIASDDSLGEEIGKRV